MVFESEVESLIYQNYFLPKSLQDMQGTDIRKFKRCHRCPIIKTKSTDDNKDEGMLWKLPRMHHCSVCERCCVKYDHHCGIAMNCIGINNYHLFALFLLTTILVSIILLTLVFQHLSASIIANFSCGYQNWSTYGWPTVAISFILFVHNLLTGFYAYKLATWYMSMSSRNMHAVEEATIGNLYDKARFHQMAVGPKDQKFFYTR